MILFAYSCVLFGKMNGQDSAEVDLGYEFENEEHDDQNVTENVIDDSEKSPTTETLDEIEQAPILTHVVNHEQLPSGGTYDTSTGVTWYFLPDGSRWWMQEDGSFLLDMGHENNAMPVEDTSSQIE